MNKTLGKLSDSRGFTLVELVVVSALFIIVLVITGGAFESIVSHAARLVKSEENHLEGIVGLEILRHDMEQAGFGLPWSFLPTPPEYGEATVFPANCLNGPANSIPCAVSAKDNLSSKTTPAVSQSQVLTDTDYLVLRGTTVGTSTASRRWTYIAAGEKVPRIWPGGNIPDGSKTIIIRRVFAEGSFTNQLIYKEEEKGSFTHTYSQKEMTLPDSAPTNGMDTYFIYGVTGGGDKDTLRMPFNRTDYFVKRPDTVPSSCAPKTGVLYKGVVNHGNGLQDGDVKETGGTLEQIPILDCVVDMQVVFGWDLNGDGALDAYSNADGTSVQGGEAVNALFQNPAQLREKLKLIKVYILAQDGGRDRNYTAPDSTVKIGGKGEASITRVIDMSKVIGPDWPHYRWKRYLVVVRPKNLAGAWN